jgi:2-aminophenol/2-amino-5-chlorophenol 1,6-dioxygenase alpha subunit
MWVDMAIVSAFLVPSVSGPGFEAGFQAASDALIRSEPDVLLVFASGWQTDGDQQWLAVDPAQRLKVDGELAEACIAGTRAIGIESALAGQLVEAGVSDALRFNRAGLPVVVAANNLGHDFNATERLGGLAGAVAERLKRRVAVIGIGGLSANTDGTDPLPAEDDQWNRTMLALISQGDIYQIRCEMREPATQARADSGFKHFAWVLGALGGVFTGATLHAYGGFGTGGGAVLEFEL